MGDALLAVFMLNYGGKKYDTPEKVIEELQKRKGSGGSMKAEVDIEELDELRERIRSLEHELASQTYQGNSIGYIHQKMECYGNQVGILGSWVRSVIESGRVVLDRSDEGDRVIAEMFDL